MQTLLFYIIALFIIPTAPVDKTTLKDDKANSYISYHCVHALHEWTGVNKNINCVIVYANATNTIEKVEVMGKVADFDSGNSSRDSHSLKVLDAKQYPNVTFNSTAIAQDGATLKVTGNLTFHNVTRPVTFEGVRVDKDNQITVKGGFSILMSDYKVNRPSFLLMKTEDKMDLLFVMVFHR